MTYVIEDDSSDHYVCDRCGVEVSEKLVRYHSSRGIQRHFKITAINDYCPDCWEDMCTEFMGWRKKGVMRLHVWV